MAAHTPVASGQRSSPRDLRKWTSAISTASQSRKWQKGLSIWWKMSDRSLRPNTFTLNAAMSACRQGHLWESCLWLFASTATKGITVDTISLNTCLSAYGQHRWRWRSALNLLMAHHLQLDTFTYTALFGASKGQWWLARACLESYHQGSSQHPSKEFRNAYMSAALRDCDWDAAIALLADGREATARDAITFKILSRFWGRSSAWQTSAAFLQDVQLTRLGITRIPAAATVLLVTAYGRQELWRCAVDQVTRPTPDVASAAASAAQRATAWRSALQCFSTSLEEGLEIDGVLVNAGLSAWRGSGVWGRVLAGHVIWLKPDVFTFSVMLEGLGASKQWLQACAIAHELRQVVLQLDGTVHRGILTTMSGDDGRSRWALAVGMVRSALQEGLELDLGNLALFLDVQPWTQGLHSIRDGPLALYRSAGVENRSLFAGSFRWLQLSREWVMALGLFSFLERDGIMTASVVGHTLAALRAAARRDEALELWKALEGRNLEKDVALLGVVLSLCDRADLWQEG
ncbi:Pentatricopeptide repeat-containing protein At2g41720 (Protein EMBRYO DEFECTIVE 2654) [Durusdinium trenchii]|uniref:Pentatricopeptide repeat-containing protein At2g41720 (Protein EMBRYO DEFECTIVE 2654) n=1 Tax=Durusdinium trenchii TaxID=1381693 RepID=A0ABP0I6Q3_9DINO